MIIYVHAATANDWIIPKDRTNIHLKPAFWSLLLLVSGKNRDSKVENEVFMIVFLIMSELKEKRYLAKIRQALC